ncbi:GNAT family N-acetyltransferase [Microbacterium sp. G2-8]|uniref:GNAT family N-acetyltransferase n=1 Tax=Microbacterium sp. G2-8 TaxID=2842454 RepID=UPI001C8ADD18|nr:GNAT family N-acetyltransferase [Microbacterium sp. G2-8]
MSITLRLMDPAARDDLLARIDDEFVASVVANGGDEGSARQSASAARTRAFPDDGSDSGHRIFVIVDGEDPAGHVWIGPYVADSTSMWWVWSIDVDEAARGRGLGREAMVRAEIYAREHGATRIGLNVMGNNASARGLYASLGYDIVSIGMSKGL